MTESTEDSELTRLRRENAALRRRVTRLEREAVAMRPLIAQVRKMTVWDFTAYDIVPDESWVAVDRERVAEVYAALAAVDHWDPWHTGIEPRRPL